MQIQLRDVKLPASVGEHDGWKIRRPCLPVAIPMARFIAWRPQVCLQETLGVATTHGQEQVICHEHSMDMRCGENGHVHERDILPTSMIYLIWSRTMQHGWECMHVSTQLFCAERVHVNVTDDMIRATVRRRSDSTGGRVVGKPYLEFWEHINVEVTLTGPNTVLSSRLPVGQS